MRTATAERNVIEIVCDASVLLKWFHEAGEQEVEPSRELAHAHRDRRALVSTLDLAPYEVGNTLIRGRAGASAAQVATVLGALREICAQVTPTPAELDHGADLAAEHGLTFSDAAYAAVATRRGARLATLDGELLAAGLGARPSELVSEL